ncbi:MAG: 50S ribosomal protein L25 [Acidimicrobiales bacterium]
MAQTVVKATLGRDLGSRPSRRLRAEGGLPGVIYGLGKEPQTVAVNYVELRTALNVPTGMNTVFTLDIEGEQETVLVRAVQRDAIKRVVTHADFLRIDPNQSVKVKVPIQMVGDSTNVTENGGMIEQQMFEIEVEVAPNSIPELIEADLSIMTLERGISVADLNFGEGVIPMAAEEISVVAPVIPRAAKVDDEAEEGEDGEEIEGAEGEGAAEGSDGGGDDAGEE